MTDPSVLIYSADPRYALTAETIVSTLGNKGPYNRSQGLAVTSPHLAFMCRAAAKSAKLLMSKKLWRYRELLLRQTVPQLFFLLNTHYRELKIRNMSSLLNALRSPSLLLL